MVTLNTITSAALPTPLFGWQGVRAFTLAGMLLPMLLLGRRRPRSSGIAALLLMTLIAGCGGKSTPTSGGGNGNLRYTPAGTYQYLVTASATNGTSSSQGVTLTLIVQ